MSVDAVFIDGHNAASVLQNPPDGCNHDVLQAREIVNNTLIMRSRSVTLRIPQILYDAGIELSEEQYHSFNELVVGLLRYALATHKPHTVTAAVARLPIPDQDAIDDEIVAMFRSGGAKKGSWFERLVKESVAAVASGKDVPQDRLARELLRRMRE